MKTRFAIDIEALAKPEISGYDCVIPNYAIVKVPPVLTSDLDFIYIQLPIQKQLDVGLKVDASTLSFWNKCSTEYPDAFKQMQKSYDIEHEEIVFNITNDNEFDILKEMFLGDSVQESLRSFLHNDCIGTTQLKPNIEIYGNGCHFDCSILQANHLKLYNTGELWHYSSPQNARTLKNLLNEKLRNDMDVKVKKHLDMFIEKVHNMNYEILENMELHNPLYDAAREALQISYCIQKLNTN